MHFYIHVHVPSYSEGSTKPDGEGGEGGGESGGGVTPGAGQVVCNQWRSVLKHSVFTAIPHAHNGSKKSVFPEKVFL